MVVHGRRLKECRVVGAQEAREVGMLNRLVPSGELPSTARELATLMARNTPSRRESG